MKAIDRLSHKMRLHFFVILYSTCGVKNKLSTDSKYYNNNCYYCYYYYCYTTTFTFYLDMFRNYCS